MGEVLGWVLPLLRDRLEGRLPSEGALYAETARQLHRLGHRDDAASLLASAAAQHPMESHVWFTLADLATHRGDWAEATGGWDMLASLQPQHLFATLGPARVMAGRGRFAEADRLFSRTVERFPADHGAHIEWAEVSALQRDWPEAERRWSIVSERFPATPRMLCGAARAALGKGDLDKADSLFAAAFERLPSDVSVGAEWANCAAQRGQWAEALHRWDIIASGSGADEGTVGVGRARCLRALGRASEAEAVLADLTERVPGEFDAWHDWADCADQRGDEAAARGRWAEVMRRFPNRSEGYTRAADMERRRARHADAEALLAEAGQRFPNHPQVLLGTALAAEVRGDLQESLRRFSDANERIGPDPSVLGGLARVTSRLGNHEGAENLAQQALQRFPDDPWLALLAIDLALNRGDFDEATSRWRALKHAVGQHPFLDERLHFVRWRFLDFGIDPHDESTSTGTDRADLRESVLQFESLGGLHEGCEFGLFQRAYDAEPLGLLRWSNMRPEEVIEGLNADFAGVGNPDQTCLEVDGNGEYITCDKIYGMRTHTFVYSHETDADTMMRRARTRLIFLRNKLLDDIKSSEKIFLYKCSLASVDLDIIYRMHAALTRHGPCTLLFVRRSDAENPFPTVKWLAPGVLVAYQDRFSYAADGLPTGERAHKSWETIIRASYRLWRTTAAATN